MLTNSLISDNIADSLDTGAAGGGIYAEGSVTAIDSTISGNSLLGNAIGGGGIFASIGGVTLINSTVSGNSTSNGSGGGVFTGSGNITITDSTISGNSAGGQEGGGIYANGTVTVERSTISGNTAYFRGGGIYAFGAVIITDSTVDGNSTSGGGVGAQSGGGGIWADNAAIVNSTVSGNSNTGQAAKGGGIYADSLTLTNSTVSGNTTSGAFAGGGTGSADGGGVFTRGNVTITNSTVTDNHVLDASASGGGVVSISGTVLIVNSIIGGNTAGSSNPDLQPGVGTLTINYSLIGDTTGTGITGSTGTGNLLNIDPMLDVLADNGGPTLTHALLPGSPAIDAGDPSIAHNLSEFDQRGTPFIRVLDGDQVGGARIDIGAYEVQTVDVTPPVVTVDGLVTNDSTPELAGTVNDETATISVDVGGQTGLVATNNGDGTWSLADDTISPALGDGTYDVLVTATDWTGNAASDATVDELNINSSDPTLLSFARQNPLTNPTDADVLVFRASFDEDVMNVDTLDFAVDGATTATVTNVALVTAGTYDVTVSGGDLASFEGVVGLDLDGAQDIADLAGNLLLPGEPVLDETYTVANDVAQPTVAITRADANPTNTSTVVFDVIFSEDVLNVDFADFDLALLGAATGDSVVVLGDAGDADDSTYTVTVGTIAGDGTLGLDVAGGTDIQDATGNLLVTTPTIDEVYTIDNTAPVVTVDVLQTSDTTPQLTGTVDDVNATISVDVEGQVFSATNNGNGTWTLADNKISPPLLNGTYDVMVTATDAVLNNGADVTVDELTILPGAILLVDTLVDENDGNYAAGDLSLREAIWLANLNLDFQTVTFDSSLDSGTIDLLLGEMVISAALTIDASSLPTGLTIDAGDGTNSLPGDGDGSRIFDFNDGNGVNFVDVEIVALSLTGGDVTGDGGAIRSQENLTVTDSTIYGNATTGGEGGGIRATGTITIVGSTISGNSSSAGGGGIRTFGDLVIDRSTVKDNTSTTNGGGINGTEVTFTNSTVSGNTSALGGGAISSDFVTLTNSTVSGNSAYSEGGGIWANDVLTISSSTITDNHASGAAGIGGGIWNNNDPIVITGSIIAENTATSSNPDVWPGLGSLTINYSLIGDADGLTFPGTGNIVGDSSGSGIVDPLLSFLANNGGPTETHAILGGSPAIDTGDPSILFSPTEFDQRGNPFARVLDGDLSGGARIDIGSYELLGVDTTAPVVTVDVLLTDDTTPELTGTVDDLTATITVDVGGQFGLVAVNNGDSTWTLADNTIAMLLDGTYDVVVTATDAALNVGTDASIDELTIDTSLLRGDMNGDLVINHFDASLFLQALIDRGTYDVAFPAINADMVGDINFNGVFDFGDLIAFNTLFATIGPNLAVTNTNESGPGSFRQAVADSNATPGLTETIVFELPNPTGFINDTIGLLQLTDSVVLHVDGGDTVQLDSSFSLRVNSTVLVRQTGGGKLTVERPFDNSGSVELLFGTIEMGEGGMSSGSFAGRENTTLIFSSDHTLSSNSSIISSGDVEFSDGSAIGGVTTVDGVYDVAQTGITRTLGVSVYFAQSVSNLGSTLDNQGGFFRFDGGGAFSVENLNVVSGGVLGGAIDATVTNQFVLDNTSSGGKFVGESDSGQITVTTSATATIAGETTIEGGFTLNLSGTTSTSDSTLIRLRASTINNDGTFAVDHDFGVVNDGGAGGPSDFNNIGNYVVDLGASITSKFYSGSQGSLLFNNSGSVDVLGGILELGGGGGNSSGSFSGQTGTTITLGDGHSLDGSSSLTSLGDIRFSDLSSDGATSLGGGNATFDGIYDVTGSGSTTSHGVAVTFNQIVSNVGIGLYGGVFIFAGGGALSVADLTVANGLLRGPVDIVVTNAFILDTGQIKGVTGSTNVTAQAGAITTISGNSLLEGSVTLNIMGNTNTVAAGQLSFRDSTINNSGTFTVLHDFDFSSNGGALSGSAFNNSGIYVTNIDPSDQNTFSGNGLGFSNSGNVDVQSGTLDLLEFVQTGGQTTLSGGAITSGMQLDIQSGVVKGVGATPSITNGGDVQPGSSLGSLQVGGNYNQTSTGELMIEIGLASSDQLVVTGAVTVGGLLSVNLVGDFTPFLNEQFTIIDNDASDLISTQFIGLTEGATFFVNLTEFQISYTGGTGNDVVLSVVTTGAVQAASKSSSDNCTTESFFATLLPKSSILLPQTESLSSSKQEARDQVFEERIWKKHSPRLWDTFRIPQKHRSLLDAKSFVKKSPDLIQQTSRHQNQATLDWAQLNSKHVDSVFNAIGHAHL